MTVRRASECPGSKDPPDVSDTSSRPDSDESDAFGRFGRATHISKLTAEQMAERVRGLTRDGFSDHEIARLLALHVRAVREWLSQAHEMRT